MSILSQFRAGPDPLLRAGLWAVISGGLIFQQGCASKGNMYDEIRSRRALSYQQWQRSREDEDVSKPRARGELSLADALKVAVVYNKSLQAALREREAARGIVTEAYSEALPTAAAIADYRRLDEVAVIEAGGISFPMGDVDNYSVGLEVRQPLWRGGGISAALRASRWHSLLADKQVRGAAQSVIYETAAAYYDILLAQHLYEVNRDAVESAKAHLDDARLKLDQGMATDFDVLRARVEVSNFEAATIRQRNRINVAKARLFRTMGASQESRVDLSDELSFAPMEPLREKAIRLAYQNRPDLYHAELNIRLQEEALRIARSRYWPRVDAWFRQSWERPDPRSAAAIEWGDAWSAGLSASWPLFDGLGREGRAAREKALLQQRKLELMDTEEQVLQQVEESVLSLRDAQEFVESQSMNLEHAEEALRLADLNYRQGIADAVTVTEARAALTRARGYYYEAVYSHTMARLNLQRAMGVLGPRSGDRREPEDIPVRPGEIEEFSEPAYENQGVTE